MQTEDLEVLLRGLAKRRPIFHSEADFQHALAWEIQRKNRTAQIRLEKRITAEFFRGHLDLLVHLADVTIAIELKYKAKRGEFMHSDEQFSLKTHGAYDHGRYDFIKDIQRLEGYVQSHPGTIGYAIILTNDESYWTPVNSVATLDAAFRIHEGSRVTGQLGWKVGASAGTMRNREQPILLMGNHALSWRDYSNFGARPGHRFRYAIVSVTTAKKSKPKKVISKNAIL